MQISSGLTQPLQLTQQAKTHVAPQAQSLLNQPAIKTEFGYRGSGRLEEGNPSKTHKA